MNPLSKCLGLSATLLLLSLFYISETAGKANAAKTSVDSLTTEISRWNQVSSNEGCVPEFPNDSSISQTEAELPLSQTSIEETQNTEEEGTNEDISGQVDESISDQNGTESTEVGQIEDLETEQVEDLETEQVEATETEQAEDLETEQAEDAATPNTVESIQQVLVLGTWLQDDNLNQPGRLEFKTNKKLTFISEYSSGVDRVAGRYEILDGLVNEAYFPIDIFLENSFGEENKFQTIGTLDSEGDRTILRIALFDLSADSRPCEIDDSTNGRRFYQGSEVSP